MTRSLRTAALATLLCACAAAPPSPVGPPLGPAADDASTRRPGDYTVNPTGRLTFSFGQRWLDGAFAPTDEPTAFGVEFSQVREEAPLGYELGFAFGDDRQRGVALSGGGTGNLDLLQSEVYAGVRASTSRGTLRPYVGAGATWLNNDTRVTSGGLEARESDGDLGGYAHAGLLLERMGVHLSLDYRMTFWADYEVDGARFDSDYAQVTLGVGVSF